jgi:cell division protein FtsZ
VAAREKPQVTYATHGTNEAPVVATARAAVAEPPLPEPAAPLPEIIEPAIAAVPPPLPEPAVLANGADRAAARKAAREAKQEQMQFEPVTRGRFEKSEPTIVDGQDLDVPTFLRRNLKVK